MISSHNEQIFAGFAQFFAQFYILVSHLYFVNNAKLIRLKNVLYINSVYSVQNNIRLGSCLITTVGFLKTMYFIRLSLEFIYTNLIMCC